ncbi:hypothetical protein ACFV42_23390 [Streptomyces solisilvae]|uniref:hypothetical protein n=1 Tax=Streptomyces malaysiensis TaxID=92644 RepID=UPI00367D779F
MLSIRTLVVGLLRIAENPKGAGVPLGPCEAVYYRKIDVGNRVILYTIDEDDAVVIEGFRKVLVL